MKVLSLFDGMGCGYEALKRAGVPVTQYHAFEIDKYAIQIAKKNHPDIIHHGSVDGADFSLFKGFDLLIGGSPCQGFSAAGQGLGFNDPRSKLFWEYIRCKNEICPQHFLLENVKMRREWLDRISHAIGCQPIFINSSSVSAQNRIRYYWHNIRATGYPNYPKDKGILLKDIIESGAVDREKSYCIDANYYKGGNPKSYFDKGRRQLVGISETANGIRPYKNDGRKGSFSEIGTINLEEGKASCVSTSHAPKILLPQSARRAMIDTGITYRKLTVIECERLQTLPDNYTAGVSNTQRYKMLGNGWTIDVLAHIFSLLKPSSDALHHPICENISSPASSRPYAP